MFLKLCGSKSNAINQCGRDQETYQTGASFAVMWYQVACHMVARLALML